MCWPHRVGVSVCHLAFNALNWVACGTCSVPGNFFQVGVCSRYNARSDWLIVTGPRADYGLAKTKQKVIKKPYNKLLTNRASSSRTGEYWPWVVFVRTSLRSVRTATTSGQYFPVRPSRSVSKRLLINSFSYFPNREKTAVNQPSPKNVFFSQKIFKVRGKKIHHFKAKKISFPTAYNLFTDN